MGFYQLNLPRKVSALILFQSTYPPTDGQFLEQPGQFIADLFVLIFVGSRWLGCFKAAVS
jgi:hypothetical protein